MMHYIGEFLDLDVSSFDGMAEFMALIQAIQEGLTHIDDDFTVPDTYINLLLLSKLEAHPDWTEWARAMMQDKRLNASDLAEGMKFHELASLVLQREKAMRRQGLQNAKGTTHSKSRSQALTQDEINSFVVRQMRKDGQQVQWRRHSKRPSQEEINEFVIQQMRKEQERKARARSKSQPDMRQEAAAQRYVPSECFFCGEKDHPGQKCRHRTVTVEVPRGNFTPKWVEFRTQLPGKPPVYRTGFALT
jgi:hypothetical protein